MYRTFGAPSGAFGASNGPHSGTESRMSTLITPLNRSLIAASHLCRRKKIAHPSARFHHRTPPTAKHHPDQVTSPRTAQSAAVPLVMTVGRSAARTALRSATERSVLPAFGRPARMSGRCAADEAPRQDTQPMATILALGMAAALYPQLLAIVVVILTRAEPKRLLWACYLGAVGMSIGCGAAVLLIFRDRSSVVGSTSHRLGA